MAKVLFDPSQFPVGLNKYSFFAREYLGDCITQYGGRYIDLSM
jgi:hypothetical protein